MNLLQESLGKGLCRATCVPKTSGGSESALKQRCYVFVIFPNLGLMGIPLLLNTGSIQLLCSCTALRSHVSVRQIFFDSVSEMIESHL